MPMLEIKDTMEQGVTVVHLKGRLDGSTSAQADKYLVDHSASSDNASVLIDASELEYMSSAGLRVLLMAAKRAKSSQGQIALAEPQDGVRQVLEISGFTSILDIHPTRAEALQALAG